MTVCCVFAVATFGAAAAASGEILYAVVVSKRTHADAKWNRVVDELVTKHKASVVEYQKDVNEATGELRRLMPRYACFVAQPDEAGRMFVIGIHRLTRQMNDDPYTDIMWGIITGYTSDDALRIAKTKEPLIIRKAAGGIVIPLDLFDEGICYKETSKNEYVEKKKPGGPIEQKTGTGDDAFPLAKVIMERKPDIFVTSGHATERDWQIGYPIGKDKNNKGMFWRQGGTLVAVERNHKSAVEIHGEDHPKVLLAAGNCLMGHCIDRNAICLAWMRTAGVTQMIGYTVNQWYPAAGFGTMNYFFSQPGHYTLNEAFYLNNQSIVYELETRFPKSARATYKEWDLAKDHTILGRMAETLGYTEPAPEIRDNLGLLWDRDTLAFYGDPAWEARLAPRSLPFTQELSSANGVYTFRIRATADCTPGRQPGMIFPQRLKGIEVTKGKEMAPLVTPNFIMLMKAGKFEKGKTYEVQFKATVADPSSPVLKTATGTIL
ncbi:MAG: hypothetical protein LLG00_05925 [Planctomycetaceae bacterium]|nr:hypothetical protein [Planctomycetaceae bacterium]